MKQSDNHKYFSKVCFFDSIFDLKKLPLHSKTEIIFAGRSNSGKSSVINAITNNRQLAIVSKKPGRTQSLNYFKVEQDQYLIDLPGYGHAQVSKDTAMFWQQLLQKFFVTRKTIKGVVLIMDIRHPLKTFDKQMISFCEHYRWPVHVVLNKSDQLNKQQTYQIIQTITKELQNVSLASFQTFSALSKQGVDELQKKLLSWLENQKDLNQ